MAIVLHRNFPLVPFGGNHIQRLGLVVIMALALQVISKLPKASALGHFWGNVKKDCYEQCRSLHGFKRQFCFWFCSTIKHLAKNNLSTKREKLWLLHLLEIFH